MSWSSCRAAFLLTAIVLLGSLSLVSDSRGQVKIGKRPPKGVGEVPPVPGGVPLKKEAFDLGNLTLPKNEDLGDRIEAAMDRIKSKDWEGACKTLQDLVGRAEDVFVPLEKPDA